MNKPFLERNPWERKKMNKKALVGDALVIAISLIIIATLGAISFSMFSLDIFGPNVKQIVKEFEYDEGLGEVFLNFLKEDSGYKGLNNLGLILLNTNERLDHNIANNKVNENLDIKECWFITIVEEGKVVSHYKKTNCDMDLGDPEYRITGLKFIAFDRNLDMSLGVKYE